MSLLDLIRGEPEKEESATATLATFATLDRRVERTVATVATVAVANTSKGEPTPLADTAQAHSWWQVRFRDRAPVKVAFSPAAAYADVLRVYPDAVAAEPFTPATRRPERPMTAAEEAAIRAWLARIGETDPVTIAQVIDLCQQDADERDWLLRRAREPEL